MPFPISLTALAQKPQQPASLPGKGQLPVAGNQPQSSKTGASTPDGTPAAYMGPDDGPFECDNCQHFYLDTSGCDRPEVLAEVGDADKDGLADVDPKGCCNFFQSGQGQSSQQQ